MGVNQQTPYRYRQFGKPWLRMTLGKILGQKGRATYSITSLTIGVLSTRLFLHTVQR